MKLNAREICKINNVITLGKITLLIAIHFTLGKSFNAL